MSNLGAYQTIVEEANRAGGPDIWMQTIKNASYNAGASNMKKTLMLPLLATGAGIGVIGTIAYKKTTEWMAKKKQEKLLTEKEAQKTEIFLKEELSCTIEEIEKENKHGKE